MFNNLRKLFTKKKRRKSALPRNEDGDLLFEMKLSKEQLYSPFSVEKNPILSPEMLEQFDIVFEEITPRENIEFLIHTDDASPEKRQKFEDVVDHHYIKRLEVSNRNFISQIWQGVFLFFIGILLYTGFLLCRNYLDPHSVASWFELLNIASWVFIWESVDVLFLGSINHGIEKNKFNKMINATITFVQREVEKQPTSKRKIKAQSVVKQVKKVDRKKIVKF